MSSCTLSSSFSNQNTTAFDTDENVLRLEQQVYRKQELLDNERKSIAAAKESSCMLNEDDEIDSQVSMLSSVVSLGNTSPGNLSHEPGVISIAGCTKGFPEDLTSARDQKPFPFEYKPETRDPFETAQYAIRRGRPFYDSEFPPNSQSLYFNGHPFQGCKEIPFHLTFSV